MFNKEKALKSEVKELWRKLDQRDDIIDDLKRENERDRNAHEVKLESFKIELEMQETKLIGKCDMMEQKVRILENKLTQYSGTDLDEALVKIKKLEEENNILQAASREVELKKAKNEISVLKSELELKDKLVKELSNLPDVKRMIENVANLRVPAIDEMEKIVGMLDRSKLTEVIQEIGSLREIVMKSNAYDRYNPYNR